MVVLGLCLLTIACYIRIYLLLHRHHRQVDGNVRYDQQPNRGEAQLNIARYKKTVSSLALVVCEIPYIVLGMFFTLKKLPPGAAVVLFRV